MSADRHELHDLIDELPEDQVALALADVRHRLSKVPAGRSWPPKFFGAGVARDGRTDIAGNIDKYLAGDGLDDLIGELVEVNGPLDAEAVAQHVDEWR